MPQVPAALWSQMSNICDAAEKVDGWLTRREMQFLATLAACPTTDGVILELGCHHGKSTTVLALARELADRAPLITVDPIAGNPLRTSLRSVGQLDRVEIHTAMSFDVGANWDRPIRLLWHDGANEDDIVRRDLDLFIPHLSDGAIIAFHDVLNMSGERIIPFIERVLLNDHFGEAGVCGSIGWSRYYSDPGVAGEHQKAAHSLASRLRPLIPYQSATGTDPRGFRKLVYKVLRSRVPHGGMSPDEWTQKVA